MVFVQVIPREQGGEGALEFADAVVELPVADWHGPVESGYGLHLVRVEEREQLDRTERGAGGFGHTGL